MGENEMIILSVHSGNELLKKSFLNYQLLVRKAVDEPSFTERVQILREVNKKKEALQAEIAHLHKSANGVKELENQPYEMINDKVLQGKLKTGLYEKEELISILNEHRAEIPVEVIQGIQASYNQLKPNEYLLFWYIEECEWRALLSN